MGLSERVISVLGLEEFNNPRQVLLAGIVATVAITAGGLFAALQVPWPYKWGIIPVAGVVAVVVGAVVGAIKGSSEEAEAA
jgi:hypothetical protein